MNAFAFETHDTPVRDPYCSVRLRVSPGFSFGDTHTPWRHWQCDRFAGFFGNAGFVDDRVEVDENSSPIEAFQAEPNAQTAETMAIYQQGFYSFDGELAFIPVSHAEDFFAHLETFIAGALSGEGNTPERTVSDEVSLGYESDDLVAYWGATTADGLFLLFAMSCDTIGENWFEMAFECYPKREEIEHPAGATAFDPTKAYFHQDCHLADHLYPDRQRNNPLFASFLDWAFAKGHLTRDTPSEDA